MRHYSRYLSGGILSALMLFILLPAVSAQNLESFEQKVTEFTLDNGLHFIIIERHVAPVASFVTFVDVGSANEPVGNTGIAHIFEHMAFKGTHYIGTTDWESEKQAIEAVEAAYQAWLREKQSANTEPEKLEKLWKEFENAQEESKKYVVNNEFSQIIQKNGGVGLNAFTSADATGYFYSLPQNRAELWFNLEADRFKNPVFREFYVEKDVVMEERRMRTDSNPVGRLIEEFLAVAYSAHPYGNPVIGWPSDIEATTIEDAKRFYDIFYVPDNITIAIAGNVDPDDMRKLAEEYFGDMPAGEPAPEVNTLEPEQRGERRFVIEEESQPFFLAGYHTVDQMHEDAAALQLLGSIISQGRTSKLYKRLVEDEKLALAVQAFNGFPGTKYQSMFLTFAVPNQGVSVEDVENAVFDEIEGVKDGSITQEELDRAITNARANLVRGLASNNGLALRFAQTHAQQGDWRRIFTSIDDLQSVTLDDLQRVANQYLVKKNRTVGMIVNKQAQQQVADAQEN
ncbi:MAG: M16 family metallopeptidase [Balneolaceae bacterium]